MKSKLFQKLAAFTDINIFNHKEKVESLPAHPANEPVDNPDK